MVPKTTSSASSDIDSVVDEEEEEGPDDEEGEGDGEAGKEGEGREEGDESIESKGADDDDHDEGRSGSGPIDFARELRLARRSMRSCLVKGSGLDKFYHTIYVSYCKGAYEVFVYCLCRRQTEISPSLGSVVFERDGRRCRNIFLNRLVNLFCLVCSKKLLYLGDKTA